MRTPTATLQVKGEWPDSLPPSRYSRVLGETIRRYSASALEAPHYRLPVPVQVREASRRAGTPACRWQPNGGARILHLSRDRFRGQK
jgi:hypothetical protein